jgi:hypothetical protein
MTVFGASNLGFIHKILQKTISNKEGFQGYLPGTTHDGVSVLPKYFK